MKLLNRAIIFLIFRFKLIMKRAFTLIELLITIAIISIVMGIVFVALNPLKMMEDSRASRRATDVVNIAKAIDLYAVDNQGYRPSGLSSSSVMLGTAVSGCDINCSIDGVTVKLPSACTDLTLTLSKYLGSIPVNPTGGTNEKTLYAVRLDGKLTRVYDCSTGAVSQGQTQTPPPNPSFVCGDQVITSYNSNSVTYNTIPGLGNTCWLDRNLGASRVATSSTDPSAYGDLFQWGRGVDGHQIRTSAMTGNQSSSDTPGNTFIRGYSDWRSPANINLWQGASGTNNPCPAGWQVPTEAQWVAQGITGSVSAFSKLQLTLTGGRSSNSGGLGSVGSYGFYWSSSVSGLYSRAVFFDSSSINWDSAGRAGGFSVRCVRSL